MDSVHIDIIVTVVTFVFAITSILTVLAIFGFGKPPRYLVHIQENIKIILVKAIIVECAVLAIAVSYTFFDNKNVKQIKKLEGKNIEAARALKLSQIDMASILESKYPKLVHLAKAEPDPDGLGAFATDYAARINNNFSALLRERGVTVVSHDNVAAACSADNQYSGAWTFLTVHKTDGSGGYLRPIYLDSESGICKRSNQQLTSNDSIPSDSVGFDLNFLANCMARNFNSLGGFDSCVE